LWHKPGFTAVGIVVLSLGLGANATIFSVELPDVLVGVEFALSLMLLIGAGLLSRSFIQLLNARPGFRTIPALTSDQNRQQDRFAFLAPKSSGSEGVLMEVQIHSFAA